MSPNLEGQHLAELPRFFHRYREAYLEWAKAFNRTPAELLAHYRRAFIGWYEARIRAEAPYLGETYHYVTTAADAYMGDQIPDDPTIPFQQNPLNYLPRPIRLDEEQQLMLKSFNEMGRECKELLLFSDYHLLGDARIAEAFKIPGQLPEIAAKRRKCRLMVREGWQAQGIMDPLLTPAPADEQLIDRYYDGLLSVDERWEVEARRTNDAVFRRAMQLREDWMDVITVAGRQDLMETLEREEGRYLKKQRPVILPVEDTLPADTPPVKLSKRKRPNLPGLGMGLAILLLAALAYLVWDTFGGLGRGELYKEFFTPYPNIFVGNPPQTEAERDLNRILYYYDEEDYYTAYDELIPVASAYPAAELYLGVSALALDDPIRAGQWLEQVDPSDPFYTAAQWYLALARLGQGRKPAASILLQEIADDPRSPYRRRATELLAEL